MPRHVEGVSNFKKCQCGNYYPRWGSCEYCDNDWKFKSNEEILEEYEKAKIERKRDSEIHS